MHYLKSYIVLFLIIPTLFSAGLYSSVSFGATDKPYIITPSKNICCKNDTSAGSESTATSLASPLKKTSTTPTQSNEDVETEQSIHELSEENIKDRNLSDLIQANLDKLLNVNSDEIEDNTEDNTEDKLDELRTMVSAVLS
ncbi:hypothetical protein BH23THE1_BH23THE1_01540 [soil metagenome]